VLPGSFDITSEPLSLDAVLAAVASPTCGAVVAFLGVVRETSDDDRRVSGLEYDVYPAMALREMRAIGAQAVERFGAVRLAIVHRVGRLAIGEASVAIAAAAPHRADAFDACEFAIDELKKRVPIWKREHYTDGGGRWLENAAAREK
jgi:molybdopterin synthase catalytic subunit